MRKLVVVNLITLDGYAAGPGGDVMRLPFDDSFSAYNVQRLRTADTLLLGRVSFEGFRDYWPGVADDPAQPEIEREISRLNTAARKVVVSDTLTPTQATGWGPEVEIVPRADALRRVGDLRAEGGAEKRADILTFGSMTTWNPLLAAGQVDELHLMVGNGVLGNGVPAFQQAVEGRLRLVEVGRLPDSDTVLLVYAPPGESP